MTQTVMSIIQLSSLAAVIAVRIIIKLAAQRGYIVTYVQAVCTAFLHN